MVNLNHKKRSSKLNESGVSLIALVITIIVVIILAAIAFNSSTSTISKANYSKFVANLSEVQDAVTTKGVTEKGLAAANGNQVTDAQAYNYIAKGGTTEADFLPNSKVPEYTMIAENADIGIELPVIKVNTKDETGVKVKFGVTQDGTVFIWPPYLYEEEYYVTATDIVTAENAEGAGDIAIKVGKTDITLKTDENGKLEGTTEAGNEGGEEDDTPLTEEEKAALGRLEIGQYVAFPQDATRTATLNYTALAEAETLEDYGITASSATIKSEPMNWKILDIDEETGKILITTDGVATLTDTVIGEETGVILDGVKGYLNAVNELNRICSELYSTTYNGKTYTARSLTLEDVNKLGWRIERRDYERYAYYSSDAIDTPDVTVNGKTYTGTKHTSAGYTEPRFYTWVDPDTGETKMSTGENDYRIPTKSTPVLHTAQSFCYGADTAFYVLGKGSSWLASNLDWDYSNMVSFGVCCADYSMPPSFRNVTPDTETYYLCSSCTNSFLVRLLASASSYKSMENSKVPNSISDRVMCYSTGVASNYAFGIRPVISLSSKDINLSDESKDGTEEKAWELK